MKINKTKITITTLALAMGAALAGSISGSVAWYQYSTRATAQLQGTSAGTVRELQIKDHAGSSWGENVDLGTAAQLAPVTPKTISSNKVTAFSAHPVYQYSNLPDAAGTEFLSKQLDFQLMDDSTGAGKSATSGKVIYLTALEISGTLANYIRVNIYGTANAYIFANSGTSTARDGSLDLNDNDAPDTDAWKQDDVGGNPIVYGGGEAYSQTAVSSVVPFTNPYEVPTGALAVGTTGTDATLTVQVWLEGWAETTSGACWDALATLAKDFSVKMRFEVQAEA